MSDRDTMKDDLAAHGIACLDGEDYRRAGELGRDASAAACAILIAGIGELKDGQAVVRMAAVALAEVGAAFAGLYAAANGLTVDHADPVIIPLAYFEVLHEQRAAEAGEGPAHVD